MDTYQTIANQSEGLYKEKGSRFIAYTYPVSSADEAKAIIQSLRKQYHDARHVCYAWSVGAETPETRSNDDGEPSGTAGRPILGIILSNSLTNILIVVVRYFGGVKLGTSGLITAYKAAAADAVANAEIIEKTVDVDFTVSFAYPLMNEVMRVVKDVGAQNFAPLHNETDCVIRFRIRKGDAGRTEMRLRGIEGVRVET